MDITTTGPGASGRRRSTAFAALAAASATALVAGAVTLALWSASVPLAGGSVHAGDLQFSVGTPTWRQTTPGVSDPASGALETTPADYLSVPGDEVEIRIPVTTTLVGENLEAGLSVRFDDTSSVAEGDIRASFHVEDADGLQVAPAVGDAALGAVASPPELTGSDAGETDEWTIVVTVEVAGDYVWVDPTAEPESARPEWTAGDLAVRLDQLRGGSAGPGGGA